MPLTIIWAIQLVSDLVSPQKDSLSKAPKLASKLTRHSIAGKIGSSSRQTQAPRPEFAKRKKASSTLPLSSSSLSLAPTQRSERPIASFVGPAHTPDFLCAFCRGTTERHGLTKAPELLISCVECGSSGHPSCMKWSRNKLKTRVAQQYNWRCMECKTCEVCCEKGDDSKIMFCDRCDRGWHLYCLRPPLLKPPRGRWECPTCVALGMHVREELANGSKHGDKHSLSTSALAATPLASSFGAWEAGPNVGSASVHGEYSAATFSGPMHASSPLPTDCGSDGEGVPAAGSMKRRADAHRKGGRVRKPIDLDRSYELSNSPQRSDSPNIQARNGRASPMSANGSVDRSQKKREELKSQSIVLRLKLSSKTRPEHSGRGMGKGRAPIGVNRHDANAQPVNGAYTTGNGPAIARDDGLAEDGSESGDSGSSIPTPRALSSSHSSGDENDESEEEDAFGGVLEAAEADTSKTAPQEEDKQLFEKSKLSAEVCCLSCG